MTYNILLIDDKKVFLQKLLRMNVFKDSLEYIIVATAKNGIEALEILRTTAIDIVFTDISMPIMDGIELLKIIKQEQLCDCTVLLSDYADFNYAKEGILNGAFDYLLKPMEQEKMQEELEKIKTFYQEKRNQDFEWEECWIDGISKYITGNQSEKLEEILKEFKRSFFQKQLSGKEQQEVLMEILSEIGKKLILEYPYMNNYIPVLKLCTKQMEKNHYFESFYQTIKKLEAKTKIINTTTDHPLIAEVIQYILTNIEEDIYLKNIADRFFVNRKYLGSLFKTSTGINFATFVTSAKVERAKVMLHVDHLKVYQVAERLGYEDVEYFSKVFKKITGKAPSTY